jgi:hypothetical protein
MELEIIMLNEISQTQKDKYHIISLIDNLDFIKDMKAERDYLGRKKGTNRRREGYKRR